MKINSITYLALFGLISFTRAAEEAGAEAAEEKPIGFFWSADAASASEAEEEAAVVQNDDGAMILSACFGLQSCVGFQLEDRDLVYAARDNDCNVKRTDAGTGLGRFDNTSAVSLTGFNQICPQLKSVDQLPRPYDAMPVTFNFPVIYDTLDINGDDFVITMADGSFTRPLCAFLGPANEGNEMHTVALIGHFGGREAGQWPESIRIATDLKLYDNLQDKVISAKGIKLDRDAGGTEWTMGSLQYGQGLSYESGLVMLKAWLYPVQERVLQDEADVAEGETAQITSKPIEQGTLGETADNHCLNDFPRTTHVIKVMFNGGVSTDGLHPLTPDSTSLFTIMKTRGQTMLLNKFLGLADLGKGDSWKELPMMYETDGDNYIDLCLLLAESDNGGADITAVMIQPNSVFPPRGTGPNIQHMVAVDKVAQTPVRTATEDRAENEQLLFGGVAQEPFKLEDSETVTQANYPYNLKMGYIADKLYDIYFAEIIEIVGISTATTLGVITVPLLGVGLGTGLLFLQAYVKV